MPAEVTFEICGSKQCVVVESAKVENGKVILKPCDPYQIDKPIRDDFQFSSNNMTATLSRDADVELVKVEFTDEKPDKPSPSF